MRSGGQGFAVVPIAPVPGPDQWAHRTPDTKLETLQLPENILGSYLFIFYFHYRVPVVRNMWYTATHPPAQQRQNGQLTL